MALGELLNGLRGRPTAEKVSYGSARNGSAERLRLLDSYEQSGQGWFWATDSEGHLTYLSSTVCDLLEKPAEALFGQPLANIFIIEHDELDQQEGKNRPLNFLLKARNSIVDVSARAGSGPPIAKGT